MHYIYLRHHGRGIPGNQLVGDPKDEQICKLIAQGIIEPRDKDEPVEKPKAKTSKKTALKK